MAYAQYYWTLTSQENGQQDSGTKDKRKEWADSCLTAQEKYVKLPIKAFLSSVRRYREEVDTLKLCFWTFQTQPKQV